MFSSWRFLTEAAIVLHNVVPAKFLWAVLTCRRAVSADASMGCETHPPGSSRGQQRRVQHFSLVPINHHPTPALVSALVEKTRQSPVQTVRNRKMLPNHVAFELSSQFFYKITSTTWNYASHHATLTFQWHTIKHILENYISSYLVIWYRVALAVSQRESGAPELIDPVQNSLAPFSPSDNTRTRQCEITADIKYLIQILRSHRDFTQTSSSLFLAFTPSHVAICGGAGSQTTNRDQMSFCIEAEV